MRKKCAFNIFWDDLKILLKDKKSTRNVFNQYRDCNEKYDKKNAAKIRLKNLYRYIDGVKTTASVLVVGEAAGPWGCRFSGIPFTGEKQILKSSFPINGERSSKSTSEYREPFSSNTAKMFWDIMLPYHNFFLAWDALPYHSHKEGEFLTVRNPTEKEIIQYGKELNIVKGYLNPRKIIAVGKKAETLLKTLGETPIYVRHPSRGGKQEFKNGVQNIFSGKTFNLENLSRHIDIGDFEIYVKRNADRKVYHTVCGTPFQFELLKPKDKASEFPYTIKFYSINWSSNTVRRVGPEETIRFLGEFNKDNLKKLTNYKNKGKKETPATRIRHLICLFQDYLKQ